MRKGIQSLVLAVGILVGGALGAIRPVEAQAQAIGDCQNRCADESCTCYYQCFSWGPHCLCEEFPICI
jgi:hypothetical protein